MRIRCVAGNWKMFTNQTSARKLLESLVQAVGNETRVRIVVFPPFPYLTLARDILTGSQIHLGAQNCYHEKEGAYTGEVSPAMLLDVGCTSVIIGHSERRHKMGETDALVNHKVLCALQQQLRVVLCVGETLQERLANKTEEVLQSQLGGSLQGVHREYVDRLVIAYEPVWAIGTGQNATPEQAQHAHAFIRRKVAEAYGAEAAKNMTLCYGGSVKPENVAVLVACPDVDGALVGGASLSTEQFVAIVHAAAAAAEHPRYPPGAN